MIDSTKIPAGRGRVEVKWHHREALTDPVESFHAFRLARDSGVLMRLVEAANKIGREGGTVERMTVYTEPGCAETIFRLDVIPPEPRG